ncbi:hypothetical protein [Azospirillum sp. A23]|uniref:hypothetical protein n=1 Tax=Azospirillum sp. A23 TaxID=3160608 RepID=UPI0036F26C37
MAGIQIAEMDFSAGLKTKHMKVPAMVAKVDLKEVPKDLQKAIDKDKIIVQKLIEAAYEQLNKSKKDIQGALQDFDANLGKKPPVSEKELAEREKTINVMCKQFTEAQSGLALKAVEKAWDAYASKKSDLKSFKLKFAKSMVLGSISILASTVSAGVSVGVAAVTAGGATPMAIIGICTTVASIGKTAVTMALAIHNFARDIEKAETDIRKTDDTLASAYSSGDLNFKAGAREVAAILGVPFVKSVGGMEKLLLEYHAKTGKMEEQSDKLYDQAKKMMTQIEKLEKEKLSKQADALVKILGEKVTFTLDKIHELQARIKTKDVFYDQMTGHLVCYKDLRGKPLEKIGVTKETLETIVTIGSTLKTIVSTTLQIVKLAGG